MNTQMKIFKEKIMEVEFNEGIKSVKIKLSVIKEIIKYQPFMGTSCPKNTNKGCIYHKQVLGLEKYNCNRCKQLYFIEYIMLKTQV